MKDFRDLKVRECAHQITLSIYRGTRDFPCEETYGIVSQLRRCSASVAANIAEGCGRSGNPEFGRFLTMAMGSASELEYFVLLSRDLNYLSVEKHAELAREIQSMRRMLNRLLSKVHTEREKQSRSSNAGIIPTRSFAKC
jgi:four helix bundle protein